VPAGIAAIAVGVADECDRLFICRPNAGRAITHNKRNIEIEFFIKPSVTAYVVIAVMLLCKTLSANGIHASEFPYRECLCFLCLPLSLSLSLVFVFVFVHSLFGFRILYAALSM